MSNYSSKIWILFWISETRFDLSVNIFNLLTFHVIKKFPLKQKWLKWEGIHPPPSLDSSVSPSSIITISASNLCTISLISVYRILVWDFSRNGFSSEWIVKIDSQILSGKMILSFDEAKQERQRIMRERSFHDKIIHRSF